MNGMISGKAKEKLLSHARFVRYYNGLSFDDKNELILHIQNMIRQEGVSETLLEEMVSTLEKYLNVDPDGGLWVDPEKILFHDEF